MTFLHALYYELVDALSRKVARLAPRRIVYWVGMRILADATRDGGRPEGVSLWDELGDRWHPWLRRR